jgi:hypothetical protein
MGNCCRVFINESPSKVKSLVGDLNAVKRFGNEPIVTAERSHFGAVRSDLIKFTEVNFINNIHEVCEKLSILKKKIIFQDIDSTGIKQYFNYKKQ